MFSNVHALGGVLLKARPKILVLQGETHHGIQKGGFHLQILAQLLGGFAFVTSPFALTRSPEALAESLILLVCSFLL